MLKQIFTESLEAQQPGRLIENIVFRDGIQVNGQTYPYGDNTPIYLIATGKASLEMGEAVRSKLSDRLVRGVTVTYLVDEEYTGDGIEFYKGSHPVPDNDSLTAGRALRKFAGEIPEDSCVIYCLSGGTSSLVCLPAEGLSIEETRQAFDLLNNSGATIHEMNTVRKHLSSIKGGQLLRCFRQDVKLIELIISDVPGDDPAVIGSGPTTPDASTFSDARDVFRRYGLWEKLPGSVRDHIEKGMRGEAPETLRPGEDPIREHHTFIIGSARKLAEKVEQLLADRGYHTLVADEAYNEDVEDVAGMIAGKALRIAGGEGEIRTPAAIICYGESTVTVTGNGKGGRNQELALRGAMKIDGHENISWLSAGTDGIDGPTDAAGAIVDGSTIRQARERGLDPASFLRRNDAYHFHQQMGTLLQIGPTGNNLMDLQVVLIE